MFNVREAKFLMIIHVPKMNMDNYKKVPHKYLCDTFDILILFGFAANSNKITLKICNSLLIYSRQDAIGNTTDTKSEERLIKPILAKYT